MRTAPKPIAPPDRKALQRQLKLDADTGRFIPLRNRALLLTAWGGALRISEVLALSVDQVIEVLNAPKKGTTMRRSQLRWRVRASTYVKVDQAKGGKAHERNGTASVRTWTSAGTVVIPARARRAIAAYVRDALKRDVLDVVQKGAPLWVQAATGRQLSERAIQYQWVRLQRRAGCGDHYWFHSLRHDALTRFAEACGGDVFKVAAFGRCDPYTAQRYVHLVPRKLSGLADKAFEL